MGWRGRAFNPWFGPWPGRGPFSYLPPWQRPGWLYGPGACWWLFWSRLTPYYPPMGSPSVTEQIEGLELYKRDLEEQLKELEKEIERLKEEAQRKEGGGGE